jgi:hypothetical protein
MVMFEDLDVMNTEPWSVLGRNLFGLTADESALRPVLRLSRLS